ncbi:hypothetical protein MTO96_048748 [Rhipicephalus appendiculatus]
MRQSSAASLIGSSSVVVASLAVSVKPMYLQRCPRVHVGAPNLVGAHSTGDMMALEGQGQPTSLQWVQDPEHVQDQEDPPQHSTDSSS